MKKTVASSIVATACDFVAAETGLSKMRVKDAMNKGAFWIRKKGTLKRLRRATAALHSGDHLEFYYDEALLSVKPPAAKCLHDEGHYSLWYKPPGLLAQGTMYGDHCALARQAELFFGSSREIFIVHRLDREVSGLMLLAHSREAAARLSELFRKGLVVKKYRAEVLGNLLSGVDRSIIDLPLDGKPSATEFTVDAYNPEKNVSTVTVTIRTGRFHQIRRHFAMFGYPLMGDPRYGKGNKNTEGLKLSAVSLRFRCPFRGRDVEYVLPEL
jgi:tRNA pseudouridine32 synthase/23S rRNA pseudouridine746 synthase